MESAYLESDVDTAQDIDDLQDAIATQYVDECLLRAVSLTNEQKGDYKQVRLDHPNPMLLLMQGIDEASKCIVIRLGQCQPRRLSMILGSG